MASAVNLALWRVCKTFFKLAYLTFATVFSLWVVRHSTDVGVPMYGYFPAAGPLVFHAQDVESVWRALETDPRAKALWADPNFQLWARTALESRDVHGKERGFLAQGQRKREEWLENQGLLRWLVPLFHEQQSPAHDEIAQREELLWPYKRQGIFAFVGGEIALALLEPPSSREKPPQLLFFRLEGGRGALARIRIALTKHERSKREHVYDLGGGLMSLAQDTRPELQKSSERVHAHDVPQDTVAELTVRPRTALKHLVRDPLSGMAQPPLQHIFALKTVPDAIHIMLRAEAGGRLTLQGAWQGPLPVAEPSAPLLDAVPPDTQPLVEADVPFNVGAAFWSWQHRETTPRHAGDTKRSDKERRKWDQRFLRLKDLGVDLEHDLFQNMGQRLRLQIAPPAPEADPPMARLLVSVPLRAHERARQAVKEWSHVLWDGVLEGRARPEAAMKLFVRRFARDGHEQYVLVKQSPPIPLWDVSDGSFAILSDAGSLAAVFGAPDLKLEPLAEVHTTDRPLAYLRADGARLARWAGLYWQRTLEAERDEHGAAWFLDQHPYEDEEIRLAEKLTHACGTLHLELRTAQDASGTVTGVIAGHWEPSLPAE